MLDDDSIGFSAKAPVGLWDAHIGVDYPGIFKALLKATLAYVTGNAPSGLSATIDGLFAFRKEPLPPPELAWLLIRRSLGHAMAKLAVEALTKRVFRREDVEALVEELDRGMADVEIRIDPAFFDRPAEHPLLDAVRPCFARWLAAAGLTQAEIDCIGQRLGAYFTFSLRREWNERFEQYATLDAQIAHWDTPFAKADRRERAWLRNAAYLQRLIKEPIFDEAFGLERVYVPLRAWYAEQAQRALQRRHMSVHDEARPTRRIIVDLEGALGQWLRTEEHKDAIRIICGGPGSGKTSVAKIWAARLAAQGQRVLFVPLHRLDFQGDAQKALADFLRDWNILPFDPLESQEGEARLLIFFDGLDELAMQGRAGQEVAREFIEAVQRRIERVNEQEARCIRVVFGGRDVVVDAAARLLVDRQVLHVLPYDFTPPWKVDEGAELFSDIRFACDRWWERFGEATGEGYDGVPEPLRNPELAEIIAQPLLNYLLALSFRRGTVDFTTAPNHNVIYADLLDAVYERPWGPAGHPATKPLSRDEFDFLLDELGLAGWHGAGRTVTEGEVEAACLRAGLQEQLARFKRAREPALSASSPRSTSARQPRFRVESVLSSLLTKALASISRHGGSSAGSMT